MSAMSSAFEIVEADHGSSRSRGMRRGGRDNGRRSPDRGSAGRRTSDEQEAQFSARHRPPTALDIDNLEGEDKPTYADRDAEKQRLYRTGNPWQHHREEERQHNKSPRQRRFHEQSHSAPHRSFSGNLSGASNSSYDEAIEVTRNPSEATTVMQRGGGGVSTLREERRRHGGRNRSRQLRVSIPSQSYESYGSELPPLGISQSSPSSPLGRRESGDLYEVEVVYHSPTGAGEGQGLRRPRSSSPGGGTVTFSPSTEDRMPAAPGGGPPPLPDLGTHQQQQAPTPSPSPPNMVSYQQPPPPVETPPAPAPAAPPPTTTTAETSSATADTSALAKRVTKAQRLHEQSEARQELIREIRQAMEMKKASTDPSDAAFWDKQVQKLSDRLGKLMGSTKKERAAPPVAGRGESVRNSPLEHRRDQNTTFDDNGDKGLLREEYRDENSSAAGNGSASLRGGSGQSWAQTDDASDQRQHHEQTATREGTGRRYDNNDNMETAKVRAPADLPEGYVFKARSQGRTISATVPPGGVSKGDLFFVRVPKSEGDVLGHGHKKITKPAPVKVRAPATLPGGYKFTAKAGGRTIVATVPQGGVEKGQIFAVDAEEMTFPTDVNKHPKQTSPRMERRYSDRRSPTMASF